MKGPRTYIGAALDELARRRLRRARRAAALANRAWPQGRVIELRRESEDVEGYVGRP